MRNRIKFNTLTIGIIFLSLLTVSVFGQKPSRKSEMGIVPGMPYASGEIENVNLTNGNLNFSFPLGNLPQGRGQATSGLFIKYNSKLWKKITETVTGQNGQTSLQSFLANNSESGWKYGDFYNLRVINRNDGLDQAAAACNGGVANPDATHLWRTQIEFPDGSVREFRPVGYSIAPGVTGNFYNVQPNGYISYFINACVIGSSQDPNPYRTYYSADGSFMRLIVYNNMDWELYMTDGSKVTQTAANGQKVYDRNGNYIQWGAVTLPGGQTANGWIDQFGRYTVKRYNTPTEDIVYQMGFNGQLLETKIRWKYISVIRQYMTECVNCSGSGGGQGRGGDGGGPTSQTLVAYLRVVDNILTPQGLTYTFDYWGHNGQVTFNGSNYSTGWGEVKSFITPSTAHTDYTFGNPTSINTTPTQVIAASGRLFEKNLFYNDEYDGTTTARQAKWIYATDITTSSVQNPDGTVTNQYFYDIENDDEKGGYVYKETSNSGAVSEKLWNFNNNPNPDLSREINPYVKAEFNTIPDSLGNPSLTAIKEFSYDKNGNVTQVKEYDWVLYSSIPRNGSGQVTGLPGGLTPIRISQTAFNNPTPDASDTSNNANGYWNVSAITIKNAAASMEVLNSSGVPVSRSEMFYDNPNTTANPIQAKRWDSSKGAYSNPLNAGNSISTTTQYNQYGMPTLTTDAKGVQTQIIYGTVGSFIDLYPTQVKTAFGLPEQRTSTSTYDFYTGLPKTATDVDNGVTNETGYDAFGRPIIQKAAINTANEVWTQTEYNDSLRRVVVRADLFVKGDGKKVAIQHFDQLSRVRLSRTLEDAATQNPYNEADGIKVQARYLYDNGANPTLSNGTYTLKSNPYRAATASQATNEETMGWERGYEDKTGNLEISESFAGTSLPAPWGTNTNSTGLSRNEEIANTTISTDQAGKKNRRIEDALGRLVRVDEPNDNNDLGDVNSPVQPTNYVYDTIGNLTQIIQGGQTRNFGYNSLNRLMQSTNPESGTFQFAYDNNGNLLNKTDARGISTIYSYDALNRVTFRNYSDATPDVSYFYDDAQIPFSKGKLTKVSSAVSETKITGFDAEERVTSSQQIIDGQAYNFGYQYNLGGALVAQTFPSGRVVTNAYDNGGDLAQVGGVFGGQNKVYADNFSYTAHEQVGAVRLGNNRWETTKFNSVMQITQVGLGTSNTDTSLWRADYVFGTWENGSINQQKNNNSVAQQTIIVPNNAQSAGFTATQTYFYDSLDRVKSAQETTASGLAWKQTFVYDRFGNRNYDVPNTTLQSVDSNVPKVANPEILPSNNRYKQDQDNDGQPDYLYDVSGNIAKDAQNRDFTYDAENRQITAVGNNLSVSYAYDGNDKRVKSFNAVTNQTTIFVYDADGDLAAEYLVNSAPSQNPTTSYLTNDALDSPRVISDQNGEVKARRDFLPFGEEL